MLTTASITLILLALIIVLLVFELVPMAIVGLLTPIVLTMFGIIAPADAFANLNNSVVILVPAIFIMGKAIFTVGLADRIGRTVTHLTQRYNNSEALVVTIVMVITAAISSVLPNLGTTAAMIPIVIAVAAYTGVSRTKLLMFTAFAASLGGMITLLGSPPNLLAKGALEAAQAGTFGFFDFAWAGIPVTICGILYAVTIGRRLLPARYVEAPPNNASPPNLDNAMPPLPKAARAGAFSGKQFYVGVVFTLFIIGVIFERQIGVPMHMSGIICAVALVLGKILTEKEAYRAIDWTTTFFIVGMLAISDALVKTGASKVIATAAVDLLGRAPGAFLLTAIMFLLGAIFTQFISNTAACGLLAPVGISIATGLGVDPRAVVMAIVIGCSAAFATPIGTPSNMIIIEAGKLKFLDYLRVGTPLVFICFIVCIVILPLVWPFR